MTRIDKKRNSISNLISNILDKSNDLSNTVYNGLGGKKNTLPETQRNFYKPILSNITKYQTPQLKKYTPQTMNKTET